ncbi:MAG: aconitate hydratase AcnA, partial [Actinobacteria bacterium]|nr:aconitate hydratase AcnA [Actinomycetota bacterium]
AKEQGMWHDEHAPAPTYSEVVELDLGTVVPSLAGPSRPQDRVPLDQAKERFVQALGASLPDPPPAPATGFNGGDSPDEASAESFPASDPPAAMAGTDPHDVAPADPQPAVASDAARAVHAPVPVTLQDGTTFTLDDGHVVIAAITSCTNTSNPSVMLAAGLLARNAVERGLSVHPWVKTSLAPGSRVVIDYYERAGLLPYLEKLGFDLVGFGCTTCIGNSGPLLPEISDAINANELSVCSVLSGNRNFEGRIHPDCRMNYLASPPLVVAYALSGTMDWNPYEEPLGRDSTGAPVFLRDIWPSPDEVAAAVRDAVQSQMFVDAYRDVFRGDDRWQALQVAGSTTYTWDPSSTYVREPPFFEGLTREPSPLTDVRGARVLAWLGDSVTTDHISPAGVIRPDSPAGRWLTEHGVPRDEFNSYGSRRGNHEVMMRGTFANVRIRNRLVPGVEGGVTRHLPSGEQLAIYDAAMRYRDEGVPLVVLAGKEYGSGSSRDWAAKGTALLGVRAVLAESYERIHRSNLVDLGVLPLQFMDGESAESLGLTGEETFDIAGLADSPAEGPFPPELEVRAGDRTFRARVRIDTLAEASYFRHGGILPYVLRGLAG